jgi:hypothetical protein
MAVLSMDAGLLGGGINDLIEDVDVHGVPMRECGNPGGEVSG